MMQFHRWKEASVEQFVRDWGATLEQAPLASPFQSTEWLRAWLDVFGNELQPTLFRGVGGGGAAPTETAAALLVRRRTRRGPFPILQMYLNTDGESPADSVIVENNTLLGTSLFFPFFAEIARFAEQERVDEFVASGVYDSVLESLNRAFVGWDADLDSRISHFVDLEAVRDAGGDLLALLSPNTRTQLRRSMRKWASLGEIEVHIAETTDDGIAFFGLLRELHGIRWQKSGQAGAFSSPARLRFHENLISRGVPAGTVKLVRISVGGTTIGVTYNLVSRGVVNFYQAGFLGTQDPQLKPGLVSHCLAIRRFAEMGLKEYDFLASAPGESQYKQSLSTGSRSLTWATFSRRNRVNASIRMLRALRGRATSVFGPAKYRSTNT